MHGVKRLSSFAQLASRLAIACSKPKSVVINDLYGRLNTCLIRSISLAILSRMVSHELCICVLFMYQCTVNFCILKKKYSEILYIYKCS